MKKITSNLLSTVIFLNILLLSACNIFPNSPYSSNTPKNITKNSFNQKGTPDPTICGVPNKLGLSISKTSIIAKDGLTDNTINVTTNLPLKNTVAKFNELITPLSRFTPTTLEYYVVIKNKTQKYERVVPEGCTNFDWDGKDNTGKYFDIGLVTLDFYFKITRNSVSTFYNFTDFNEQFLNITLPNSIAYSPNEGKKVASYMYASCLSAPNNLVLVLNTNKADSSSIVSSTNTLGLFNNRDILLGATNASNNNAPVFVVPSQTTLVTSTSPNNIGKLIAKDEPSCSFTPFLTEDELNFNTEKTIEIKEEPTPPLDPATTKFFEVEDFKKLSEYADKLNIDDSSANALYDAATALQMYQDQKQSFIDRGGDQSIKIAEIDAKIQETTANISALQGNVLTQLSTLYNDANILANHVNSITETQYITPYPPEEKPDSAWSYSQQAYGNNQSITTFLSDALTLYEPDPSNPNQDDVSLKWDIEHPRAEALDPENLFLASKSYFDEIQGAKDLSNDLMNNNIPTEDISVAISALSTYLQQIKAHSTLLKARAKEYNKNYTNMVEKIIELHKHTKSELTMVVGSILEDSSAYDDNTYRLKSVSSNDINVQFGENINKLEQFSQHYTDFLGKVGKVLDKVENKTGFKVQAFKDYAYYINEIRKFIRNTANGFKEDAETYRQIIASFDGSDMPTKEKNLAIFLAIDKTQWDKIKKENPTMVNELLAAWDKLIEDLEDLFPDSPIKQGDLNKALINLDKTKNSTIDLKKKTPVKIDLSKQQLKSLSKASKYFEYLFKIYTAWEILQDLYDFYKKAVPVKKAANKFCYGFDTSANVNPNGKEIRCLNELGNYLFDLSENKALRDRYPLYTAEKIIGKNDLDKLSSKILIPSLFKNELRKILYNKLGELKEDIIEPINISDPDWAWKSKIYNGYYKAYSRFILFQGIKINKINLKNREPVLYSPKIKDRTGDGLITSDTGFIIKMVDINGDTLLKGNGSSWDKNDFREPTKKFLLDVIVPYVNNLNEANPSFKYKIPNIIELKKYLTPAFTWHHDEEFLDEMVLMPKFIHKRITHWGAASILEKSKNNKKWRNQWKNILIYN